MASLRSLGLLTPVLGRKRVRGTQYGVHMLPASSKLSSEGRPTSQWHMADQSRAVLPGEPPTSPPPPSSALKAARSVHEVLACQPDATTGPWGWGWGLFRRRAPQSLSLGVIPHYLSSGGRSSNQESAEKSTSWVCSKWLPSSHCFWTELLLFL